MADQSATFAIELDVKGQEGATNLAASLTRLRDQMKADQAAVSELQNALRRLQGGGQVNVETFKNLRDQLKAKQASLASATEAYARLGGAFGEVKDASGEAQKGLSKMLSTMQQGGGPLGELAGGVQRLTSIVGGSMVSALLLGAAVIVALAAAAVAATVALLSFAAAAADAARSTSLLLQASTGSAAGAAALEGQIGALAGRVAVARDKLEQMALSLSRSGLAGKALASALSAVATESAVMGDAAGSALQSIAERARVARRFVLGAFDLQGTGLKLADVAQALATKLHVSFGVAVAALQNGQVKLEDGLAAMDAAVQAKFGKIAKAQLIALPFQLAKARDNLSRLFSGVKIEGFLEGLSRVLGLLDESTASGRALRTIAETMLSPIFDALGKDDGAVRDFFRGMIIAALELEVSVLKLRKIFRDVFGAGKGDADSMATAIFVGKVAFVTLLAIVLTLAAAFGILAALMLPVVALFVGPFVLIGLIIYGIVEAVIAVVDAVSGLGSYLAGLDWGEIGTNLVNSLINGLSGGAGLLVEAAKRLGSSAISALKSTLGIASPSKVFMKLGAFTAEGFAGGLEDGAGDVESATRGMISIPSESTAGSAGQETPGQSGQPRAQAGGGLSLHIDTLNINGVKGADDPGFIQKMAEGLETVVQSMGIRLQGATT